jgi:hypothetical protein
MSITLQQVREVTERLIAEDPTRKNGEVCVYVAYGDELPDGSLPAPTPSCVAGHVVTEILDVNVAANLENEQILSQSAFGNDEIEFTGVGDDLRDEGFDPDAIEWLGKVQQYADRGHYEDGIYRRPTWADAVACADGNASCLIKY